MNNVTGFLQAGKTGFGQVAAPFLDHPGLPFADALSATDIEQAFAQRDALFATGATFSTPIATTFYEKRRSVKTESSQ